ncbi:uncharacterized protein LOC122242674 [Penaeus japonicus]|uniref:uncharacterized protein LOC122242674 n=1 Tax=Penaeus japonicus TaxID=27405 RepID=UPI001C70FDB8|nr:uncharacterized protein LOC122242674 [Penaeus japonicus]
MGSCLPWLLIASFVILGIAGGLTASWAYYEFPSNANSSLTPPEKKTYNNRYDHEINTDEYSDYLDARRKASNYFEDCRLYVIIPSGVNVLVSAVLVVACLISRKVLSTTTVLHSVTSLWAINMAVAVWFQYAAKDMLYGHDDFRENFFYILGIHIAQLILLTIQVFLAGLVLHQQKVKWVTINFSNLLTISTVVLAARMTLAVYSLIVFCDSSMRRGVADRTVGASFWNSPRMRFPDYYVFSVVVLLVYGAVVSAEGLLSLLLGKVHVALMGATGLVSGIGYCYIAVIASPAMMIIITGHDTYYQEFLMIFALGTGLLSIIHGIITLVQPKRMVSPLNIPYIFECASKIFKDTVSKLENHTSSVSLPHANVLSAIEYKVVGGVNIFNGTLAVLSLLSLILASVGADNWGPWPRWPSFVLIGSNMVVLCRILPSIITQCQEKTSASKTAITIALEGLPSVVGAIGGWCTYDGPTIAAAVITFLIFLFDVSNKYSNE